VNRKHSFYTSHSVRSEVLDSPSLRVAEPNLHPSLIGGLLVNNDAVIYPPCATAYFLSRATELGATVLSGRSVVRMENGTADLSDGSRYSGKFLINAAGSWASQITPGLAIRRRKGHLAITDRYRGFVRHQLVELGYLKSAHSVTADSVAFNVQPRQTGQILIGSSRQYDAESRETDRQIQSAMLQRAIRYLPALQSLTVVRTWTGFRPATPDKLPLIGPHPFDPSVLVAAGHEGLGITTSLGTAALITSVVMGTDAPIPAMPYLPSRRLEPASLHG
jgi:D-hydroxyproline dehydrogenase subunit beta